ncbi:MAG: hypothetical protein JKY50_20705 [Oleispira sp.]|nr:hypothetical protein [Oleispira sp.]
MTNDDEKTYNFNMHQNPTIQLHKEVQLAARQHSEAIQQTANNTKQQVYKTEELISLTEKAEQRAIDAENKAEEALSAAGLANTIAVVAMIVGGTLSVASIILTLALNI